MRAACTWCAGAALLERWLAEGFHLIPREVRAKAACLRRPPHDTAGLCDRLDDLSLCFFLGEPPGRARRAGPGNGGGHTREGRLGNAPPGLRARRDGSPAHAGAPRPAGFL